MNEHSSSERENRICDSISELIEPSRVGDDAARDALLVQIQHYLQLMADRQMDPALQQKIGPSDVVQQTMTRVIENFDDFQGETAAEFRGWLKAIVVNEVNAYRRMYRTQKRDVAREQTIHSNRPSEADRVAPRDRSPTPSTEAMTAERLQRFYEVLEQLPEDYAEVIRCRSLEKLSFKETALRMNRTYDSVTKLWYRAVLDLEGRLKELGEV